MRAWRRAAALFATLAACVLRADGDSGEALLTPTRYDGDHQIVENAPDGKLTLASADCVKRPEERDGWGDGGTKRCYARRDGVGLLKNGESALLKTLEVPDFVTYVAVTVSVSTASAAKDKSLTLELKLRDDEPAVTQDFSFVGLGEDTPLTLVFAFEEGMNAEYFRLRNLDEGNIFQVGRVVWKRHAPGIRGSVTVPSSVRVGAAFRCSLGELSGGSGNYVRAVFAFEGQSATQEPAMPGLSVPFVAPDWDGSYPLTVTVWDDLGASVTLTEEIRVAAYAPPRNLRVTEASRTGFTLTWDIGPLSPLEYHVSAVGDPETLSPRWRPEWDAAGEGRFVTREPLELSTWTQGEAATGFCRVPGWEGTLEASPDGIAWESLPRTGDLHAALTVGKATTQPLWLRATGAAPPASLSLVLTVGHVYRQVVKHADGQLRAVTFEGLPAGRELQAVVSASYPRASGGTILVDSEPLTVALEPIPAFQKAEWADGMLTLTWPEGSETLSGEFVAYAEREVPHALPPGLYLTRTCFTSSKGADGKPSGFGAGKGFVLTNTTSQPIHLKGTNYSMQFRKDGGKAQYWYFTERVEDPETGKEEIRYPYVVPAGGELAFSHGTYGLPEVREGTAVANFFSFTPEYAITLLRDAEPVNAMGCATNAIRRLAEDRLDRFEDTPLVAATPEMAPFYDAWTRLSEEEFLRKLALDRPWDGGNVSQMFLDPKTLAGGDLTDVTRIWAECAILDGASRSAPLAVELWVRERPTGSRRGFRLRLR